MAIPIALLVDDSCPLVHVYRFHWQDVHKREPLTAYGARLADEVPNDFLDAFCDVVEARGIRGKMSIVPAPARRGDIVAGINGDLAATRQWLATARQRLAGSFDFCPEGITHNLAVDLGSGRDLDEGESAWSQHQDRSTLTPYLARSLQYLRDAGIDATGVTSPWVFGIDVEPEYVASIVEAQRLVYGRQRSWYFLHMLHDTRPAARPWVARSDGPTRLVSIPSTVADIWWKTIDSPRQDRAFVEELADQLLTADGRGGKIRAVLDAGGWPVLLTHWQSLFSNGLRTGLRVLDEVGRRVGTALRGETRWASCSDLAAMI